ncbi:MAG: sulfatase family protein, partial [Actinomycetes bacterium]
LPVEPLEDDHRRPRGLLDKRLASRPSFEHGDIARLRANYAGNLSLIDDQIGEILRAVEERGELDRTVVALVSDHGEMNGDHGLLYKKCFLEPAVRIPFAIRLPPALGGQRDAVADSVAELMDIGATFVDLAGGKLEDLGFARSVVPAIEDPQHTHRSGALSEFRGETMIATPDWKLVLNRHGKAYLLFDLHADPHETRNLAALSDYADVEHSLKRALRTMVKTSR